MRQNLITQAVPCCENCVHSNNTIINTKTQCTWHNIPIVKKTTSCGFTLRIVCCPHHKKKKVIDFNYNPN